MLGIWFEFNSSFSKLRTIRDEQETNKTTQHFGLPGEQPETVDFLPVIKLVVA
jgi:hypothetical protein